MINFRPNLRAPGFNFQAPEEEAPGFHLNADGSTGQAPAPTPEIIGNPFDIAGAQPLAAWPPPYLAFARQLGIGASEPPAADDGSSFPGAATGERRAAGFQASNLLFDPSRPRPMTPVNCTSTGDEFSCTSPGGTSFGPLPAPRAFPGSIGSDSGSHHEYRYESDPFYNP